MTADIALRPGLPSLADVSASIVVSLVALPLCLGIALASGAPMVSGLVAGVLGGVLVGVLSGSRLMVSGPAAGLTALVLDAGDTLGSFERVLVAVVIGGLVQLALGAASLGKLARFVPSPVVKGMLAAIGLILILKQIPHAVGWDADAIGDETFAQADQQNTLTELFRAMEGVQFGAAALAVVSVVILVGWKRTPFARLQFLPPQLVVVVLGIAASAAFASSVPLLRIDASHFVDLPTSAAALVAELPHPEWAALADPNTWGFGVAFGLVGSLESLLSLAATTRIDPRHEVAPANRELLAQGAGNLLSGLLGGLPLTGVIVRSAANVDAGAKTRWSAILHGVILAAAVLSIPAVLNKIPLAVLAAILLVTGFNLTRPALWAGAWRSGRAYFAQFSLTVLAILFTDLLTGTLFGLAVNVAFILWEQVQAPALLRVSRPGAVLTRYALPPETTFLHKDAIERVLQMLRPGDRVEIDARQTRWMDFDVIELLQTQAREAAAKGIDLRLVGVPELPPGTDTAH